MNEIPCSIIRDILPYYMDDLVSDVSRELVDAHLTECPRCRQELEAIRLDRKRQIDSRKAADRSELDHLKRQNKINTRTLIVSLSASVIIILLLWVFMHWTAYPIRPDGRNIGKYIDLTAISDEYGTGYASVPVTVYEMLKADDRHSYVLFEKNNQILYGILESDFTGWYRKPYGSYIGTVVKPYFTVKLVGTGQAKYLLFAGRNPDLSITHATIETEGYSYDVEVPNRNVFMVITPVDESLGYVTGYGNSNDIQDNMAAAEEAGLNGDNYLREWKLADTPRVQVFDASDTDISSKYVEDDDTGYDINPDLSNLESCVKNYYEKIPNYSGVNYGRHIGCIVPFKNYYYVLTEEETYVDILRLSRSMSGRYRIDSISQGFPGKNKAEVDWLDYKGKQYVIFGCMDCPPYAKSVRFSIYDRYGKNQAIYKIELPEERPDGYCIAISEASKGFAETPAPKDVFYLP